MIGFQKIWINLIFSFIIEGIILCFLPLRYENYINVNIEEII
jgi:hypothetical protein